eukprot:14912-Heterococcus_DN1.PRE.3
MSSKSFFARRELSALPIDAVLQGKLAAAGFRTVGDVCSVQTEELMQELDISEEHAADIRNVIDRVQSGTQEAEYSGTPSPSQATTVASASASQLLFQEKHRKSVISFSRQIDGMLGGGFPCGELTEIFGTPGTGKTQLAMQLSVNAQIPMIFGGVGGEAVYIDCEGSFTPERVQQMASAVSTHLSKLARNTSSSKPGWVEAAAQLTPELICSKIHCFRVHNHEDQIATVRQLPDFLTHHPGVLLVVLDSVAFHFRHAYASDIGLRSRMLSKMAQQLNERSIAVVVINQMTTKFDYNSSGSDEAKLAPALVQLLSERCAHAIERSLALHCNLCMLSCLYIEHHIGESWSHAAANKVMLFQKDNIRFARLMKSAWKDDATVPFSINSLGVRDASMSSASAAGGSTNQSKRARTSS